VTSTITERRSTQMDGVGTDRSLPGRRRRWAVATWLLVGSAALLVTVGLSRARTAPPAVERSETRLASVARETLAQRVSGPGRLVPRHVRWLTATHRARVEQLLVQPGDRVEAQTQVAVLNNPEIDLALLEARRELAAARIQVAGTRRQLEATADVLAVELAAAREQARAARESEQRLLGLQAAGVASRSDQEDAQSRQRELSEREQLLSGQAAAAQSRRASELEPGQALVASLEQIVAHRQRQLAELSFVSGAPGVVQSVHVEPGQWVEAGFLLAKVVISDELSAELAIDELDARQVQVGQPVTLSLGSSRLAGQVAHIDPMAVRGTVTVDVTLEQREPGLRPDQRISGDIEVRRYPDALSVRTPLQVTRAGHYTLFKLSGPDELVPVDAELVPASADRVLVKSGLSEGDQIVISDLERFKSFERLALH
jgi:multidrug efflux pump subunit AcrA (membrane-fusion protein)